MKARTHTEEICICPLDIMIDAFLMGVKEIAFGEFGQNVVN